MSIKQTESIFLYPEIVLCVSMLSMQLQLTAYHIFLKYNIKLFLILHIIGITSYFELQNLLNGAKPYIS